MALTLAEIFIVFLRAVYSILFLLSLSWLSGLAYLNAFPDARNVDDVLTKFLIILPTAMLFSVSVFDVYGLVPWLSWAIHEATGNKFLVLPVIHGLVSYSGGGSVIVAIAVNSFMCLLVSIVGLYGRRRDCRILCLYLFLEMIAESLLSLIGRGFLPTQLLGLITSAYPLMVCLVHPRDHLIRYELRIGEQPPTDEPRPSDIEVNHPNGEAQVEVQGEVGDEGEIDELGIELT